MHAWEAIQTTLNSIEDTLGSELSIEALAQSANLSPFYFQRLFSRLVKKPVREYIKLRRLARASEALKEGKQRILDIALDHGFSSHETFTRAFKEAYGLTPEQFKAAPSPLNHFDKPDLLLSYTMIDEGVPLISDGLIIEFNRRSLSHPLRFLGVAGIVPIKSQMPLGEETGIDMPGEIWKRFHEQKHLIPRLPSGREIGVAYLGGAPQGHFTYYAGAEALPGADDTRFTAWELPAREYVVCGFEAENFEQLVTIAINKAVKFSSLWLEKHGLTMELYSPEIYYDSSPEASYMELWLPANKKA